MSPGESQVSPGESEVSPRWVLQECARAAPGQRQCSSKQPRAAPEQLKAASSSTDSEVDSLTHFFSFILLCSIPRRRRRRRGRRASACGEEQRQSSLEQRQSSARAAILPAGGAGEHLGSNSACGEPPCFCTPWGTAIRGEACGRRRGEAVRIPPPRLTND